jgi:hypothetical protein
MSYGDLVRLYFERSTALQWYWTIYVLVIGGVLAFSSLRQRGDTLRTALICILYVCFAYKNLGAIHDVTDQRLAVIQLIKSTHPTSNDPAEAQRLRDSLEPTLVSPEYPGIRNFHVVTDILTVLMLWTMELRRKHIREATEEKTLPRSAA